MDNLETKIIRSMKSMKTEARKRATIRPTCHSVTLRSDIETIKIQLYCIIATALVGNALVWYAVICGV